MAFDSIFGFQFKKTKKDREEEKIESFVPPSEDEGAVVVDGASAYGTYLDFSGTVKNDYDLITRYRDMLLQPEVESSVDDVCNDAIVLEDDKEPVSIDLDDVEQPEKIKKKIEEAFKTVCKLLDFNNQGFDIFKKWYVDGRINYHTIIEDSNPGKGIIELRYIDPRRIRKVVKYKKEKDVETGAILTKKVEEYFVYSQTGLVNQKGYSQETHVSGLKVSPDEVVFVHSGILDRNNKTVLSHLHKAIKPLNQLRMLEDAVVIYRIARAPERRIFYIDVGNMPRTKADQYLRRIMTKYKNKLVYDINTGEARDTKRHLAMLEDFWLPRREGSQGTQIDTLPGGQNLGEMEDVEYFQKKLLRSLNVPVTRMDPDNGFNMGKAAEITRDELKFAKFITRLRKRFSMLFDELLKRQLLLTNVIRDDMWDDIRQQIKYDFVSDSYFAESKDIEIMADRLELLDRVDGYVGTYFSRDWTKKHVLRQNEDDIREMKKEMKKEESGDDEEAGPVGDPGPGSGQKLRIDPHSSSFEPKPSTTEIEPDKPAATEPKEKE